MKRSAIVSAVAMTVFITLLAIGIASAADIKIKTPAEPSDRTIVPYKWDGSYVGGYVGVQQGKSNTSIDGWTDSRTVPVQKCHYEDDTFVCKDSKKDFVTTSTSYPAVTSSGNVIGPTLGLYLGYNKQMNSAMFVGVEVDGGYSGARDNEVIYALTSAHSMPWNFNLTGRVGFLPTIQQETALYLKAGLNVKQQRSEISGPSGAASESKTKAGWTAGLGIEHKFSQRLSARVEGMYEKVSDQTVSIPGASTTLNGGSWNIKTGLALSF